MAYTQREVLIVSVTIPRDLTNAYIDVTQHPCQDGEHNHHLKKFPLPFSSQFLTAALISFKMNSFVQDFI